MSGPPLLDHNGVPLTPDRPPTYVVMSILVTLFCCVPFGIVGIVYGSRVISQFNAGDLDGAKHSSEMAEKWSYGGIGAAILLVLGRLVFYGISRFTGH